MTRHDPIEGQPAALVIEEGAYLARFPFDVAGELEAFKAARAWIARAHRDGLHMGASVEHFDGSSADVMRSALLKAKAEIEAHWTREELARDHCGMEVALDRINQALRP